MNIDIDSLERAIAKVLGVAEGDVQASVTQNAGSLEVRAVVKTPARVEYRGWSVAQ